MDSVKNKKRSRKAPGAKFGFTLLELLVVIAIIGILSSIIFASINAVRAKARDARRLSDMRQILTALEMYYNDHGKYPDTSSYNEECHSEDISAQTGVFYPNGTPTPQPSSFIYLLAEKGYFGQVPVDPINTITNCDEDYPENITGYHYSYTYYDASSGGCENKNYFVLGVRDMESTGRPHPSSPGWSCQGTNWGAQFDWVTGKYN